MAREVADGRLTSNLRDAARPAAVESVDDSDKATRSVSKPVCWLRGPSERLSDGLAHARIGRATKAQAARAQTSAFAAASEVSCFGAWRVVDVPPPRARPFCTLPPANRPSPAVIPPARNATSHGAFVLLTALSRGCSRSSTCCCPLAPVHHSASGLAINICDVLVEEGGPRVEAERRGGDPLPRASCRAKLRERAGSRVVVWGVALETNGLPTTLSTTLARP